MRPVWNAMRSGQVSAVWVSATTGDGMESLQRALVERVGEGRIHRWIAVGPTLPAPEGATV